MFAAGTTKPAESNQNPAHEVAANLSPLLATLAEHAHAPRCPAMTLLSSGGTVYGPDAPTPTPETSAALADQHLRRRSRSRPSATSRCTRASTASSADILRCANVYGPGEPTHGSQGLIGVTRAALRANRPVVVFGDGSARRDFVHVDDVAAVVVALAARPAGVRVLNVGSGRSVPVRDVIEAVARSLGEQAVLEHRPGRPTDRPRRGAGHQCAPCGRRLRRRASLAAGLSDGVV